MSEDMLTVRLVCQRSHLIASVTQEGERVISALDLKDRMMIAIGDGAFGSTCSRCGATRDTWRIEVEPPLGCTA